jgi:hypothetical protein
VTYEVNGNGLVGEIGGVNSSPVSNNKFKHTVKLSFESLRTYYITTSRLSESHSIFFVIRVITVLSNLNISSRA